MARWISPEEFCKEYGISTSTQAKWRMERKIPYSKIGRFVRYNRDLIDEWLLAHQIDVA